MTCVHPPPPHLPSPCAFAESAHQRRLDHLTVRAPPRNARMDGIVNPPQSLLCRVQPSCACDAVMSSPRGCRGLNWPFGLDAVRLGRVQVKRRMRLSCWCDLKSHTLARLPQVAPSHKCGGSREEEEDEDRQKCRGEKWINVK